MRATANFNLRKRKDGYASIILIVRILSEPCTIKYTTGFSIRPDEWSVKAQRPVKSKRLALNKKLNSSYEKIESLLTSLTQDNYSPNRLREQIAEIFGHGEAKNNSIIDFARKYSAGNKLLTSTVNSLKRCVKGKDLLFDEVKPQFVARYTEYLKETGIEGSTINFHLTNLNRFIKESFRQELHTNSYRLNKNDKISLDGDDQIPIALEPEEILAIANLKLEGRLEASKDLFMLALMSGQRFVDAAQISPNMIKNGYLRLTQSKTGKRVGIPLHIADNWGLPFTLSELLEKYGWRSPKVNYVTLLRHLRKIGEMCITSQVEIVSYPKGVRVSKMEPKAKHLTSHVARRSFCTLLYKSGLSLNSIRKYSGHKNEKILERYIGISEQEQEILAERDLMENMKPLSELSTPGNVRSINFKTA